LLYNTVFFQSEFRLYTAILDAAMRKFRPTLILLLHFPIFLTERLLQENFAF